MCEVTAGVLSDLSFVTRGFLPANEDTVSKTREQSFLPLIWAE